MCGESKQGRISEALVKRTSHLLIIFGQSTIIQAPGGLGDMSDLLAKSVRKRNILSIIYMQIY
jgi:hypothetical protein